MRVVPLTGNAQFVAEQAARERGITIAQAVRNIVMSAADRVHPACPQCGYPMKMYGSIVGEPVYECERCGRRWVLHGGRWLALTS